MKNFLFQLILILLVNTGFSQLSNKHWIPPLHSREASSVSDQYLYLSTQETTPFQVRVTDGAGNPIGSSPYSLSAANPVVIDLGIGQNTKMFLGVENVNIVLSDSGIILEGTKDFYASFRVRSRDHAEILVSKGRPGIGNSFRLGHIINEPADPRKSFVASVMATENNTNITLSDYDPSVTFITGFGIINPISQSFTLNAGQSIIFSGYSDNPGNLDGAIGALITADKPVAVNSGNALAGIADRNGDFALDQIVSSSQIGNEYIFIEGNGLASMESPLIVADDDNTEIFINGSTTPITTINAGDYFLVDNSYYQGTTNRNIYVRTSKNVYAYQFLGGGNTPATAGLNFIPPLSCFFQNSVNIPEVNVIGATSYNADLMILTYTTATLTLNGANIPTSLAQTVQGNTDWVTYRISGVNGNTSIQSTGPLAVGVFGSSSVAGFAGYYSGFGSNPVDTEVVVCTNETINLFEAITGNPGENGTWTVPAGGAPLNNNIFDPAINIVGDYYYEFTKDCNSIPTTFPPVKVSVSIEQAPNAGISTNYSTCTNANSIDLFSLLGNNVTLGGTWTPALSSGTGIYNPAVEPSGIYTYTIKASNACNEVSASVTVTNNSIPSQPVISDFNLCDDDMDGDDTNGSVTFNLNEKTAEITTLVPDHTLTYHTSENEALAGNNSINSIYSSNRRIYVRLTNITTGCFFSASFNLVVNPKPVVNSIVTLKQCDTDSDATTTFNLTQANLLISSEPALIFTYHNSLSGAENNNDFVTDEINHVASNGSQVWARISNSNGCFRTSIVNLIVSATVIPQTYRYSISTCDDYLSTSDPSGDGIGYFDLTEIEPLLTNQFPTGQSYTYSYYLNQTDAETEQNAIVNVTNYRNTIPSYQIIWVRIESNLFDCAGLGPFLELIVNPIPNTNLGEDFSICVNARTGIGSQLVDATPGTPGNYSYSWTPSNPNGNISTYNITAPGTYTVTVTNIDTSCSFTDSVSTFFSSEPENVRAELITPAFSSGLTSIRAVAQGGFGVYEYSLNGLDWQSSPIFTSLPNGTYTIYVRDIQGCGLLLTNTIQTITYPNYFTPNGDGYNDRWNINLPEEYNGLISIFDRYGKLIKQLSPTSSGWDGTFNGELLPATDYWFKVVYTEGNVQKEFKSHFTLKR